MESKAQLFKVHHVIMLIVVCVTTALVSNFHRAGALEKSKKASSDLEASAVITDNAKVTDASKARKPISALELLEEEGLNISPSDEPVTRAESLLSADEPKDTVSGDEPAPSSLQNSSIPSHPPAVTPTPDLSPSTVLEGEKSL